MATKTFKIGEYANGGIITAVVNGNKATVINKEWDFSAGSNRKSNQSNAKVLSSEEFTIEQTNIIGGVWYKIEMYLGDLTTSYYAGQITEWIKEQVYKKK